jgi:hypothetical protein
VFSCFVKILAWAQIATVIQNVVGELCPIARPARQAAGKSRACRRRFDNSAVRSNAYFLTFSRNEPIVSVYLAAYELMYGGAWSLR